MCATDRLVSSFLATRTKHQGIDHHNTVNSEMHHHNTRQKHNLHFTFNKLSFSIRSQGPKIWHSIPYTLRNSLKYFNYKRILKDYYLSQAY